MIEFALISLLSSLQLQVRLSKTCRSLAHKSIECWFIAPTILPLTWIWIGLGLFMFTGSARELGALAGCVGSVIFIFCPRLVQVPAGLAHVLCFFFDNFRLKKQSEAAFGRGPAHGPYTRARDGLGVKLNFLTVAGPRLHSKQRPDPGLEQAQIGPTRVLARPMLTFDYDRSISSCI